MSSDLLPKLSLDRWQLKVACQVQRTRERSGCSMYTLRLPRGKKFLSGGGGAGALFASLLTETTFFDARVLTSRASSANVPAIPEQSSSERGGLGAGCLVASVPQYGAMRAPWHAPSGRPPQRFRWGSVFQGTLEEIQICVAGTCPVRMMHQSIHHTFYKLFYRRRNAGRPTDFTHR